MYITKCINNNIVTTVDDQNREVILMGRGIGFGKKPGMRIAEENIEKIFRLETKEENGKLLEIISDIPMEHIKAADRIIDYARDILGDRIKDTIYLSLIDHINCAIERYQNGMMFTNPLLWEMKQYYNTEYRVSLHCLDLLEESLGIRFPEDEAGFITFHFITSEYETRMSASQDIPKLVHSIVRLIESYFGLKLDDSSIHYERFITHLKFFAARVFTKQQLPSDEEVLFRDMIRKSYEDCYNCAQKISQLIEKQFHVKITDEEIVYLTVHIKRVIMK